MTIDFQPIESGNGPQIDFQPIENAVNAQPAVQAVQASASPTAVAPSLLSRVANSGPVNVINAAGAGIGTGIANAANKAVQFGTDIAQGTGAISPQTRTNINDVSNQITAPNDLAQQAMATHPTIAGIGQGVGVIGTATAAALGLTGMGAGILGTQAAGAIANAVIGAAASSNGLVNRSIGGALGGGSTLALNYAAKGVTALANTGIVKSTLDKALSTLNSRIEGTPLSIVTESIANRWNTYSATSNQMFNSFRSAPGDFSKESYEVGSQIHNILDTYTDSLSPVQKSILNKGLDLAKNGSTIADMHDVRLILNSDYDKFLASNTGQPIYKAFTELMSSIDNSMKDTASKAGVLDKYLAANDFYKTQIIPLHQFGAKDIADAAATISKANSINSPIPIDSAKTVTDLINKYVKPGKAEITQSFMGMLDENGQNAVRAQVLNNAVEKSTINGSLDFLKLDDTLSKLKGTYAQVYNTADSHALVDGLRTVISKAKPALDLLPSSGTWKDAAVKLGALGGLITAGAGAMGPAGAIAIGGSALAIKSLMNTSLGQLTLKALGSSSMGTQLIDQTIKATAATVGGMHNTQVNTPPHDEHSAAFLGNP